MQKLHESERKLTAKARDQRGHLERVGPLNWEDRVGKWGGGRKGGRKKGEGKHGVDQRPGNQSGGGFSPWLLRGETEERRNPAQDRQRGQGWERG